jgi:AcrR family transcriptional regulator
MPASTRSQPGERSRHSRLTANRERDIYQTVLTVLREVGYEALTMDEVAARAKASKATLYRRWQGKPQLVAAALRDHAADGAEALNTGSLVGDLNEIASRAGGTARREDLALLGELSRATCAHPELAAAVYEYKIRPELETLRAVVGRAVERGEVAADNSALDFLPHLISGAALARPVLEGMKRTSISSAAS